jgi:aminoglycoside/choline kinase family phosphotransferase
MDHRLEALRTWLAGPLGAASFDLRLAAGDASFRRYLRVVLTDGRTRIAMDAPPPQEDIRPWLKVAALLRTAGVRAPTVLAHDAAQGFVLMDDLGDQTYQAALAADIPAAGLYRDALTALVRMQAGIPVAGLDLPPYDRALLRRELELFRDWACVRHLGLTLSPGETALLDATFTGLEDAALAMPQVFVHRDWHARNLMRLAVDNPGVLDFQDAVIGPLTYDLVSLTRDAYLEWSETEVAGWLAAYHAEARAAGLPVPATLGELTVQHDVMGMQRHLKVVGIFARLWHRDGKAGYLDDVPRVVGHLLKVAPMHAPALADFLVTRIQPGLAAARARARA